MIRNPEHAIYLIKWKALAESKDLVTALVDHFSYLASSPTSKQLLQLILDKAVEVSYSEEKLIVKLSDENHLLATPPVTQIPDKYPASYNNVIRMHSTVALADNASWGYLTLGEHGMFKLEDGWFDEDIEQGDGLIWEFAARQKSLIVPIAEGYIGNYFIYHPTRKNKSGEPKLYYLEHDGMEFLYPESRDNVNDLFLRGVAYYLELYSPEQHQSALGEEFAKYLNVEIEKIKDKKIVQKLKSADWQEYADDVYETLTKYWKGLAKKTKAAPVGSIVIGWNDGEDSGIDIDYVEGNDEDFYDDGASLQFETNVISFDSFFEQEFGVSSGEELQDEKYFEQVKNILCRLTQEMVQASTGDKAFHELNKKEHHRIWFYNRHDEDMIEIYNSTDGKLSLDGNDGEDDEDDTMEERGNLVSEFQEACKDENIETIVALIQRFPEIKGKFEMEQLASLFFNRHNQWLRSGEFNYAKQILSAYHNIIPVIGHSERIEYDAAGTAIHMRQAIADSAVVLAARLNDPEVFARAKTFIPDHITDANLAFNLACYYAIIGDKEQMLRYTRLAINLGTQKKQFMADSDFDFCKNDKDFLEALE